MAVELPPSLRPAVEEGLDRLPEVSVVLYRDRPAFLAGDDDHAWFVPIDPCDGIIEALRIARVERTQVAYVDAEVEDFQARPVVLPDVFALRGLGLSRWYESVRPLVELIAPSPQDAVRERHMAARLVALSEEVGPDRRVLFVGGLAHWGRIRALLDAGSFQEAEGSGPAPDLVHLGRVHGKSLVFALGEMPWITWRWQEHRAGIEPEVFDPADGLKDLLLEARASYEEAFPDSLEKVTTPGLRTLLTYARKLCLQKNRLFPDAYTLTLAAKGTIGNDYAVTVLETSNRYPPNAPSDEDTVELTESTAEIDGDAVPTTPRTPGEPWSVGRLNLRRRPPRESSRRWKTRWNPHSHCSWPPEDLVIENFREYVTRRALTLAGMSLRRTEPFTTSFKDGIAVRETLRDWHEGRVHVREEPRVAGDVGALVLIFEEDDDGTRFPWRTTWMAEHENESTLAFYSTTPQEDMVGPGIGRIFYGGCMFIFPPLGIPDVWEDMRFERARRPSERLLLAAIFWSAQRFVAYAGPTPPRPEVVAEAERLGKHVVYLPLTSFSGPTLERLRRAHVLNGREVRSWAARFIS